MPGFESPVPALALLVRAGTRRCALRAADVLETMRPLPVTPVGDGPGFALGAAVIRGRPTPVVDLARLLGEGGEGAGEIARFVCLRVAERRVALAVAEVIDLRPLSASALEGLPPLLSGNPRAIEALGALDDRLLLLLESARILPGDYWERMESRGR